MNKEFVLTDGQRFIRQNLNGKFEQVSNITLADRYTSKKFALNIKSNSIPKAMSRNFYVAEMQGDVPIQLFAPITPKQVKKKGNKKYAMEVRKDEPMWYDRFVGIEELFSFAKKRSEEIAQQMSDIDSTISDLEHYIEFNLLNAREGYKAYKELSKALQERRKIKDEQRVVMSITKNFGALDGIKHIVDAIGEQSDREYRPRILCNLFEAGIDHME